MPVSSYVGKQEMMEHIVKNVPANEKVLDVGVGEGTYSMLLKPRGFIQMHAVEIYTPYIEQYNLTGKYVKVYNTNIMDFIETEEMKDFKYVILGDVLEHLTKEDGIKLVNRLKEMVDYIMISVPYLVKQGTYKGNVYEAHLQDDLTPEIFAERYPEFTCIVEGHNSRNYEEHIGCWVWKR